MNGRLPARARLLALFASVPLFLCVGDTGDREPMKSRGSSPIVAIDTSVHRATAQGRGLARRVSTKKASRSR
jgi:hypothetical protein